jgi:hypothetical protein
VFWDFKKLGPIVVDARAIVKVHIFKILKKIQRNRLKPNLRPYIALQQACTWLLKRLKSRQSLDFAFAFNRFTNQVRQC